MSGFFITAAQRRNWDEFFALAKQFDSDSSCDAKLIVWHNAILTNLQTCKQLLLLNWSYKLDVEQAVKLSDFKHDHELTTWLKSTFGKKK